MEWNENGQAVIANGLECSGSYGERFSRFMFVSFGEQLFRVDEVELMMGRLIDLSTAVGQTL